jgi:hypothetical protein
MSVTAERIKEIRVTGIANTPEEREAVKVALSALMSEAVAKSAYNDMADIGRELGRLQTKWADAESKEEQKQLDSYQGTIRKNLEPVFAHIRSLKAQHNMKPFTVDFDSEEEGFGFDWKHIKTIRKSTGLFLRSGMLTKDSSPFGVNSDGKYSSARDAAVKNGADLEAVGPNKKVYYKNPMHWFKKNGLVWTPDKKEAA